MPVPDHCTFGNIYAGQSPWEIGRPQRAFLDADRITGSALDAGCGTGESALYFTSRGQKVTGIDLPGCTPHLRRGATAADTD